MSSNNTNPPQPPLHIPAGMFVIHLRSDSKVSCRQLVGRVEHVVSGVSERFASLDALLAFIAHCVPAETPPPADASGRRG